MLFRCSFHQTPEVGSIAIDDGGFMGPNYSEVRINFEGRFPIPRKMGTLGWYEFERICIYIYTYIIYIFYFYVSHYIFYYT